jgi:hypothetical protein
VKSPKERTSTSGNHSAQEPDLTPLSCDALHLLVLMPIDQMFSRSYEKSLAAFSFPVDDGVFLFRQTIIGPVDQVDKYTLPIHTYKRHVHSCLLILRTGRQRSLNCCETWLPAEIIIQQRRTNIPRRVLENACKFRENILVAHRFVIPAVSSGLLSFDMTVPRRTVSAAMIHGH